MNGPFYSTNGRQQTFPMQQMQPTYQVYQYSPHVGTSTKLLNALYSVMLFIVVLSIISLIYSYCVKIYYLFALPDIFSITTVSNVRCNDDNCSTSLNYMLSKIANTNKTDNFANGDYAPTENNSNLKTSCNKSFCSKTFNKQSQGIFVQLKAFWSDIVKVLPPNDPRSIAIAKFDIDSNRMFEVHPNNDEDLTSFTYNKGTSMGVCVQNSEGVYSNINDIKFVFAHELAHVGTTTYGHDNTFWDNFKWLLGHIYEAKLIPVVDYKNFPAKYCKLVIDSNPYLDKM